MQNGNAEWKCRMQNAKCKIAAPQRRDGIPGSILPELAAARESMWLAKSMQKCLKYKQNFCAVVGMYKTIMIRYNYYVHCITLAD